MAKVPPRIEIAPGLEIPRLLTGLWQVADMERGGKLLDPDKAAASLADYAAAGFDAFDMADHYGSAEDIVGRLLAGPWRGKVRAFTKWCPPPGPMTPDIVRDGVGHSLRRLGVERIDLMQFHWWQYRHPAYLDALAEMAKLKDEGKFGALGLTNFDTDHLRLLVKHGIPIATNQVSFSLLDRRAAGRMSEFCLANGVKLLAYGTLAGGFLTDRWVAQDEPVDIPDWSKSKYKRFIDAVGGWAVLQGILGAASRIAKRHGVSVANVATRWVLDHPAVAAAIVGARPGEREHRTANLGAFDFSFDSGDRDLLDTALAAAAPVPGDCGDEYRHPPFLTASGDLTHHLESMPKVYAAEQVPGRPGRWRVDSASVWEPIAGYSRAVRVGTQALVSGTTATHGKGAVVCEGDAEGQAVYILDKIAASLDALGASLDDVVRTRVYLADADDCEAVSRVHGRYFGAVRPANTLLEIGRLVGAYKVEIDAEAIVDVQ
jgi:aryl-alcohol dehydrogenase-like predicted oxidoreductase/enamine deaminase RidA (YjgF/YER057c/UK114 family)